MRFRKLRIAWSVVWGIIAVLLIALWVRSYSWHDTLIYEKASRITAAGWNKGELFFLTNLLPDILHITLPSDFRFQHEEPEYEHGFEDAHFGFQMTSMPGGFFLLVPFWLAIIGAIVCSVASQIHWSKRFSLRTLLIAMTLVAMVLGLVAWVMKMSS
jgi:hypothetical protein